MSKSTNQPLPRFTVIVPVYRDLPFIKEKARSLLNQSYPAGSYEVIFAHGGAKRDALEILHDQDPLVRVIHLRLSGKTYQLNRALELAHGDWIVQTDTDSIMDSNCLQQIASVVMSEAAVGCVGVWTVPGKCHIFERVYWLVMNWWRWLEARIYSASHVCAPCFAYRRRFVHQYPHDVIADDVYVPLHVAAAGYWTAFIRSAKVTELRAPNSMTELVRHKGRKGNAFLRELLRVLYRIGYMPARMKLIYLVRLVQFTLTSGLAYAFTRQNSQFEKVGG